MPQGTNTPDMDIKELEKKDADELAKIGGELRQIDTDLEVAREKLDRAMNPRASLQASKAVNELLKRKRELLAEMDKVVDALHMAIIDYLGRISLQELSKRQSKEMVQLVQVANALEQIGDRVATGLVTSASKRIDENVVVSEQTAEMLASFHATVVETLSDVLTAVAKQDAELAKSVRQRRKELAQLAREVATHGIDRLTADEPNRLRTYTREMEVVEILDSVFSTVRRIARTVG